MSGQVRAVTLPVDLPESLHDALEAITEAWAVLALAGILFEDGETLGQTIARAVGLPLLP